ncbi:MAG: HAD hydrolase-like protein [Saccharofermentans sp.]|nr:HAD hydrolase-like protein [Saccharofermentans sp.]
MKAIVFDIGQTLTYYPIPLNWSKLYRPAFGSVAENLGIHFTEEEYTHFGEVLTKYNTRINPREKEYSSDTIFTEMLENTSVDTSLMQDIKREFYSFFSKLGVDPSGMMFVGDEIKDMLCAHNAGAMAVLINRTGEIKDYGQDIEIKDLTELVGICRR